MNRIRRILSAIRHPRGMHNVDLRLPPKTMAKLMMGATPDAFKATIFGNGILTDPNNAWPTTAAKWWDDNTTGKGSAFTYLTGIFHWGEAGHIAALVKANKDLRAAGAVEVNAVMHSYGCQLLRKAAQADPACVWDTVVLVAAADLKDCGPNGNGWNALLAYIPYPSVKRLVITVSKADTVLATNRWWPVSGFFRCLLGIDGPANCSSPPLLCAWKALPSQPFEPYTVARDDTADHFKWFGSAFDSTLNTIAAFLGVGKP